MRVGTWDIETTCAAKVVAVDRKRNFRAQPTTRTHLVDAKLVSACCYACVWLASGVWCVDNKMVNRRDAMKIISITFFCVFVFGKAKSFVFARLWTKTETRVRVLEGKINCACFVVRSIWCCAASTCQKTKNYHTSKKGKTQDKSWSRSRPSL